MSAIHKIAIDGEEKEVVAFGDVFEYVEDADFTSYESTAWHEEGQNYMVGSGKPYDDPDFGVVGEPITLNDGREYIPVNFGERDDRIYAVDEAGLYDEVWFVYEWSDFKKRWVCLGNAYASEEDAGEKLRELNED